MPREALPIIAQINAAFSIWNTGFDKDLAPGQVMNPAQWQAFNGVNELTVTTATVAVGNFCSGSFVVGPLDARSPRVVFTNTDDDFKDIEGVQVPSYSIAADVI